MQERRSKNTKKGSQRTFMREARRLERLQWLSSVKIATGGVPLSGEEQYAQSKLILQLAWKTVALMRKNTLIQQKIVDLQKETSDFITALMNNPDNQNKCLGFTQLDGLSQTSESSTEQPYKI